MSVSPVSEIFFPQRPLLKLDGRAYSPLVLERIASAGGLAKSFVVAAKLLKLIGEIDISSRQVNNLTVLVGEELACQRDRQTVAGGRSFRRPAAMERGIRASSTAARLQRVCIAITSAQ